MDLRVWLGAALLGFACAAPVPAAGPAASGPISTVIFRGLKYAVCTVEPATQDLRVYWADSNGNVLGNFTALQHQAKAEGGDLLFAANAGMFDTTSKPCGLLVQNGEQKFPVNLNDGRGNFYMKPNGVFAINQNHHALIVKSEDYAALLPPALWATQSGPLLVIGGDINPDFMPDSHNRYVRSGVGITADGKAVFALSQLPVTFYEFATLFVTKFHCRDALYLDGGISDFWQKGDIESAGEHHFGPMIGVLADPQHEGVTAAPPSP